MSMFNKETIERIYEESWSATLGKGKRYPTENNPLGTAIAEMVGSNQNVLDIGCGTGKCMLPLAAKGNQVIGVDVADSAQKILRTCGFQVLKLDVENEPTDALIDLAPFDVVIMTDVLEHLIDPLVVLKDKVYPLLKPQGKCIATVPNFVFISYRLELLMGRISHFNNDDSTGYDIPRPYNLGHKTLFNQSNLLQTFQLSGFSTVQVEPELFSESLKGFWRFPVTKGVRKFAKIAWPTLLAARFLVIAQK